jgi:hypothetical protein
MNPVDHEDCRVAAAEATDVGVFGPALKRRNWAQLGLAHVKVAALCPALAATIFWLLGPERSSLIHLKGLFAFIVTVGCTYLFFGVFAVAAVALVSPVVWILSKIPWPWVGRAAAFSIGGGAAWFICKVTVNDMPPFQIALVVTATVATVLLERAWRRSVRAAATTDGAK